MQNNYISDKVAIKRDSNSHKDCSNKEKTSKSEPFDISMAVWECTFSVIIILMVIFGNPKR